MSEPIVIQRPTGPPGQLILLFHGVGSTARSMVALGQRLALEFPQAAVFSVPGPDAADTGAGFQWFSVQDITEENRPQRIAAAMPRFTACIRGLQAATGSTAAQTALVGFSQGAIMALESTQIAEPLAGRVVAIAGRFAHAPEVAPPDTTLHFIHGKSDPVIAYGHTVTAAERLIRLGGDVTADVIPFLGHGLDDETGRLVVERLKGYIPKRVWDRALQSAPPVP